MRNSGDWSVTSLQDLQQQVVDDSDALSTVSSDLDSKTPREICQDELTGALDFLERQPMGDRYKRRAADALVASSWKMQDALRKPEPPKPLAMPPWQRCALELRRDIRMEFLNCIEATTF